MAGSRASDRQIWLADVLDRYERPLLRFALRRVGNLDTAREIVQDAFVQLCRERSGAVDEHVGAWLFRVCRNRAIDAGRHASHVRLVRPPGGEDLEDRAAVAAAAAVEAQENVDQALRALSTLSDDRQEVLLLKFQAGMSYKQIAEITGHSLSNVGFLIHAGIKELRARLGEHVSKAAGRETA